MLRSLRPLARRLTARRLAAILAVAVLALTLSGCVIVKNVSSTQADTIGGVQITGTICASGSTTCPENGNIGVNAGPNNNLQLLVAYRVSVGVTPPATLRFTGDPGTGPLLTPNASYTAELQRLLPAPAGTQWFGYSSTLINYLPASSQQSASLTARFELPKDPAGGPSVGPFQFRMVVGSRGIDLPDHPIEKPVACGSTATDLNSMGSDGQTICIDSPVPATIATSSTQATRDIAVRSGSPVAAAAGAIAAVPFALQYAGSQSSTVIFGLSATTTIPGAAPVVSPATLTPTTNSTTPVLASVPVPGGTPPGTYPVTLTATISGQTRAGTSSITILPAGGGAGAAAAAGVKLSQLSIAPKSINRFRGARPATLTVTLGQGGTLRVGVARSAKGRRNANGRCVAPAPRLIARGAARCTRFVTVTTINRPGLAAGVRTVTFSGRGRVPGLYRLTATLRSAGLVSPPLSTTVTVKP